MSYKAAQDACGVKYPAAGAINKAVYCVLAGRADDVTRQCFLKMTTIADEAWTSERSARRAVVELVEMGAIRIVEQGTGRGNASVYEVIRGWQPPVKAGQPGRLSRARKPAKSVAKAGQIRRESRPNTSLKPARLASQQYHEQNQQQYQEQQKRGTAGAPHTPAGRAALSESSPPVAAREAPEHEARTRTRVRGAPASAPLTMTMNGAADGAVSGAADGAAPEARQDMSSNRDWKPKGRPMPHDPPAKTPAEFIADLEKLGTNNADDEWRARLHTYRGNGGKWDAAWGPPPGEPGCRVPAHLLGGATVARKGPVERAPAEAAPPPPPPPIGPDPALPLMPFADPPKTGHDLVLGIAYRKGVSTIRHDGVTYRLHCNRLH